MQRERERDLKHTLTRRGYPGFHTLSGSVTSTLWCTGGRPARRAARQPAYTRLRPSRSHVTPGGPHGVGCVTLRDTRRTAIDDMSAPRCRRRARPAAAPPRPLPPRSLTLALPPSSPSLARSPPPVGAGAPPSRPPTSSPPCASLEPCDTAHGCCRCGGESRPRMPSPLPCALTPSPIPGCRRVGRVDVAAAVMSTSAASAPPTITWHVRVLLVKTQV